MAFVFRLIATDGNARHGEVVETPHGAIRTPAFMPVGTLGAMKGIHWHEVRDSGADIVLANTYHLMLRPTAERVARLGGLHKFANWSGPILTDSGGFQVMSLSELRKVSEDAVTFRSHIDGAKVDLSPERAVEIQALLGSDISMQLDECIRLPAERADIERAMRLSLRWAERSKRAFDGSTGRALFGIVQGGDDRALRVESARALADMDFHGYAIGGLAVGEPQDVMLAMIDEVMPHLPRSASALPDGRRHARRSSRSGRTRHRHVRLRAADPQRPSRHGVHSLRPDQHEERPPRRRPASARCRKAAARPRATIRAPICITSRAPTRCWAPCCYRWSISTITRT